MIAAPSRRRLASDAIAAMVRQLRGSVPAPPAEDTAAAQLIWRTAYREGYAAAVTLTALLSAEVTAALLDPEREAPA